MKCGVEGERNEGSRRASNMARRASKAMQNTQFVCLEGVKRQNNDRASAHLEGGLVWLFCDVVQLE